MANKKKTLKIIGKTALIVLLSVIVLVSGYVVYFAGSFYRINDNLSLPPVNKTQDTLLTSTEYTMLNWNIGFGAYSDNYSFFMDGGKYSRGFSEDAVQKNLDGIKERVSAAATKYTKKGFDFICYQEVDYEATRSYQIDQRKFLYNFHDTYSYVFAQNYDSPYILYPFNEPHGANKAGIMTFSKYRIESAIRKQVPVEKGFMKYLDLDRCYSKTRISVNKGERELVLINLHLSAYTSDGTIAIDQLKLLLADCKQEVEKGNYVICAGDFNKDLVGYADVSGESSATLFDDTSATEGWAKQIDSKVFEKTGMSKVEYTEYTEDPVPSCRNADRPYSEGNKVYIVDGFLISDNVHVIDALVLDEQFKYSDHNPVVMSFKLKK